jgi:hypothetical protein
LVNERQPFGLLANGVGLEEVGGVLFERSPDLLHRWVHESDGADDHGWNGLVAVRYRSDHSGIVRVRPDVVFIDRDTG